jgi:hypothetical protein
METASMVGTARTLGRRGSHTRPGPLVSQRLSTLAGAAFAAKPPTSASSKFHRSPRKVVDCPLAKCSSLPPRELLRRHGQPPLSLRALLYAPSAEDPHASAWPSVGAAAVRGSSVAPPIPSAEAPSINRPTVVPTPNPSIEGTASGLRPPAAPHVKR